MDSCHSTSVDTPRTDDADSGLWGPTLLGLIACTKVTTLRGMWIVQEAMRVWFTWDILLDFSPVCYEPKTHLSKISPYLEKPDVMLSEQGCPSSEMRDQVNPQQWKCRWVAVGPWEGAVWRH